MIAAEETVAAPTTLLLDDALGLNAAATKVRRGFRPLLSIAVLAWGVRLVCLFNMVNALVRYQPKFIFWLGKSVPLQVTDGMRIRMFLASMLLFILASGLQRGKKLAWQITIVGLLLAPVLHLDRGVIWPQAVANLLLVIFLVYHHKYFVVASDPRSIRSALIVCPILVVALLVFGTIRLHALHKHTVGDHTWPGCARTACELVFTHHSTTQLPMTQRARDLYVTLRLGGTGVSVVGLFLILRPVLLRRRSGTKDRRRARELIEKFGRDPFDPYAMLADKKYFFSSNGQAVVPYALSGNLAVALADPIGSPRDRQAAISDFALFCRNRDWQPVFYEVAEELIPYYEQAGLFVFKIGEEARLRSDHFDLKGGQFQNLRTACNHARKHQLTFRWYDATGGIDEELEKQLAEISRQWLEGKRAKEMTFDMGAFSLETIRRHGASLAVDPAGKVLAFATWRPFAQNSGRCLDLMRARAEARNVMDFVLVESIRHFEAQGVYDISLGNAPLANADKDSVPVGEEKAVQFLFENLNRIYGYKPLFEFKRKYRPVWQGRYVAYHRGARLPMVGLALARVHAPGGMWNFLVG